MDFDYVVMPAVILVLAFVAAWLCVRRICLISVKTHPTWRKIAERVLLSCLLLVAIFFGVSSSINAIRLYYVRAMNPPSGAFYTVDGRKMHIDCAGSGSPAIVLEAGSGGDGLVWGGVQPVLSETTRVCSYDRAGLGWSEPRLGPRDADHIVSELHELLLAAHVNSPIVLMGHSVAGLYIREYASRYPGDVAGLVFVDGSTPSPSQNHGLNAALIRTMTYRPLFILGIPRLLGYCSHPKPGFDAKAGILQREDLCHTQYGPVLEELKGRDRSDQQTVQTGPYGELPILIFSHDPKLHESHLGDGWDQDQERLKGLSSRSKRIIARGSSHYVQFDRVDLIEKEVPLFIQQIRGEVPSPTDYGSTTTE